MATRLCPSHDSKQKERANEIENVWKRIIYIVMAFVVMVCWCLVLLEFLFFTIGNFTGEACMNFLWLLKKATPQTTSSKEWTLKKWITRSQQMNGQRRKKTATARQKTIRATVLYQLKGIRTLVWRESVCVCVLLILRAMLEYGCV